MAFIAGAWPSTKAMPSAAHRSASQYHVNVHSALEPVHVRPAAREVQKRDGLQNDAVRIEESEHAGARPERVPEDYGTTVNLARAVMVRVTPSSEPPNGRARLVMRT